MDWQEMTLNTYDMLLINNYFVSWVDSGPRNTKQKLTVCVSNFVFHEQYCGTIDKYRERWIIQIWNISFPLGRWCLQTAQLAFQSIYPCPSCLSMWIPFYSHRQTRRCRPRRPWSTNHDDCNTYDKMPPLDSDTDNDMPPLIMVDWRWFKAHGAHCAVTSVHLEPLTPVKATIK